MAQAPFPGGPPRRGPVGPAQDRPFQGWSRQAAPMNWHGRFAGDEWHQPPQHVPGHGEGPGGQPTWFAYAPPKPKRPTELLVAIGVALVVLTALLVYALASSPAGPASSTVPYENEHYELPSVGDPPPLPHPATSAETYALLEDNPLYQVELAEPVRCELKLRSDSYSLSDAELESRMATFIGCLTRAWGPAIEEAGFEAYQPEVLVYPAGTEIHTQCGTAESMNAFYCPADQMLYLAPDIAAVFSSELQPESIAYEWIMAHEYGHAIEGRIGVMSAHFNLALDSSDDVELELSRRLELQADCFAGMTVRSLSQSLQLTEADHDRAADVAYELGDDSLAARFGMDQELPGDHGSGKNRMLWNERGMATNAVAECNTWTANQDEVR